MKRILTLSVLLTVFTFAGFSQTGEKTGIQVEKVTQVADPVTSSGAVIEFESKEVDYGFIENGSEPFREFKFTNTGTEGLVITNCKGSCGCTVPQCPKEEFAPGESGTIKVRYDTKRNGRFTKTITVNTNAANSPVRLIIKGEVKQPATIPAPVDNNVQEKEDHSGHNH